MNVGELKGHLAELPDDLDILTASDEEGNSYRPLYFAPSVFYIDKNADKHGYVESVYSEDDLVDNEEDEGWDKMWRGDVEPRLIIG